jgi:hypothetical protein
MTANSKRKRTGNLISARFYGKMPMSKGNGTQEAAQWTQLSAYVTEQLWAGRSTHQVVRELQDRGLDYATAVSFVEAIEERLRQGGAL